MCEINDENFKIIRTLRDVAPRVLGENPKISNPNANVDIASGALLHHVGLTDPTYYTNEDHVSVAKYYPYKVPRLWALEDCNGVQVPQPQMKNKIIFNQIYSTRYEMLRSICSALFIILLN